MLCASFRQQGLAGEQLLYEVYQRVSGTDLVSLIAGVFNARPEDLNATPLERRTFSRNRRCASALAQRLVVAPAVICTLPSRCHLAHDLLSRAWELPVRVRHRSTTNLKPSRLCGYRQR